MGSSTLEALVQQAAAGRSAWKFACRVVATSAITLSGTQTIDSVLVAVGDRVLVTAQAAGKDNGIYVVASGAWTRAVDMDEDVEVPYGITIYILEGTVNARTCWNLTSPTTGPITLGSTALTFGPAPTSLLGTATAAATPNTLCLRDGSAQCAFSAVTTGVVQSAANSITISAANGAEIHARNGTTVRTDILDPTGANTVTWVQGITSLVDSIAQKTSGAGSTRTIAGQQGFAGSVGGQLVLQTGYGGTPGTNAAGGIRLDLGAAVSATTSKAQFTDNAGTSFLDIWQNGGSTTLQCTSTMLVTSLSGGMQLTAAGGPMDMVSGGGRIWAPTLTIGTSALASKRVMTVANAFVDQLDAACTSFTLNQAQHTSAAGNPWTIKSQQGAAGSIGGTLTIGGGAGGTSGTNLPGDTRIDLGVPVGATSAKCSILVNGSSILDAYQPSAAVTQLSAPSSLYFVATSGQLYFSALGSIMQFATPAGYLSMDTITLRTTGLTLPTAVIQNTQANWKWSFDVAVTSPTFRQDDQTAASSTGTALTVQAQNATGATSLGGKLALKSGTGTAAAGNVEISAGSALKLTVDGSGVLMAQAVRTTKNTATFGATTTFDLSLGAHQQVTMTGNITTLTISNQVTEGEYEFTFIQDATGSRTLTLPAVMKVAGGTFTLSTGANKRDKIRLRSDGTNLYEVSRSMNV